MHSPLGKQSEESRTAASLLSVGIQDCPRSDLPTLTNSFQTPLCCYLTLLSPSLVQTPNSLLQKQSCHSPSPPPLNLAHLAQIHGVQPALDFPQTCTVLTTAPQQPASLTAPHRVLGLAHPAPAPAPAWWESPPKGLTLNQKP